MENSSPSTTLSSCALHVEVKMTKMYTGFILPEGSSNMARPGWATLCRDQRVARVVLKSDSDEAAFTTLKAYAFTKGGYAGCGARLFREDTTEVLGEPTYAVREQEQLSVVHELVTTSEATFYLVYGAHRVASHPVTSVWSSYEGRLIQEDNLEAATAAFVKAEMLGLCPVYDYRPVR